MEHKHLNCLQLLEKRRQGLAGLSCKNTARLDLYTLRSLVVRSPNTRQFQALNSDALQNWPMEIQGNSRYSDGKLIFRNFRTKSMECYCVKNNKKIARLWSLPAEPRWEDYMVFSILPTSVCGPLPLDGHTPSVIVLRSNKFLERYLLHNGDLKEKYRLSETHKFTEIVTDPERNWIILKSTRRWPRTIVGNTNRKVDESLLRLIVMERVPLKFLYQFEIGMPCFGHQTSDANICNGMLVVMYQGNMVRLYNLDILLKTVKSADLADHTVTALPLNVQIDELPPPLLEIKAHNHHLEINENPWIYIKEKKESLFAVYHLDGKQIGPDIFCGSGDVFEPDCVTFMPNESGMVVRYGELATNHRPQFEEGDELLSQGAGFSLYRLVSGAQGDELKSIFNLHHSLVATRHSAALNDTVKRDRQPPRRPVRQAVVRSISLTDHLDSHSSRVYFDYENELDILAILITQTDPDEYEGGIYLKEIRFYDGMSLDLLSIYPIDMIVRHGRQPCSRVNLFFDLDLLVIKVISSGKTSVMIYQLSSNNQGSHSTQTSELVRR